MSLITFRGRWKEELEATSDEGTLIFEMTMGVLHVYFPDMAQWQARVPPWARGQHDRYLRACEAWCAANGIAITIKPNAHVYAER